MAIRQNKRRFEKGCDIFRVELYTQSRYLHPLVAA